MKVDLLLAEIAEIFTPLVLKIWVYKIAYRENSATKIFVSVWYYLKIQRRESYIPHFEQLSKLQCKP